ncbi:MAG: hypothetical protein PWQ91_1037 [Eubacteriales bacterium]|nr:hypothetical protein [Eubacteriales bacterium]
MDWVVASAISSALMALFTAGMAIATFWMARGTQKLASLQQEQLRYSYAPTFFADWMEGGLYIRNKGRGPAYDARIFLKEHKNWYLLKKVAYWPEIPVVQYDLNAPDVLKIEGSGLFILAGEPPKQLEIVIFFTDHLQTRYKALCCIEVVRDFVEAGGGTHILGSKLEFPKGKVFCIQPAERKEEAYVEEVVGKRFSLKKENEQEL